MVSKPQLAYDYNPAKDYKVSGWWSSPKLDGVRCLYIPGQGLMSRTLKLKYVGLGHIESLCYQGTSTILDGELYIPGESFDGISGIARDTKNINFDDKKRMQFHVFAQIIKDYTFVNTELMIESISESIPDNQSILVPVPYTYVANNPAAIQAQNQLNATAGFPEGTMLRHPTVAYREGRSHDLVKVKNFVKSNFVITGFVKGKGKYAKSLGNLVVTALIEGVVITSNVGTGFTDVQRQELWDNQTQYLGEDVEIIYLGVTDGKKLRHPVFLNFV